MKKFFALLVTMAMVMSLFSGVVLAAAGNSAVTIAYKAGASTVAGNSSTIVVTVTDPDAAEVVKYVEVDFGATGFFPTSGGTATWAPTVTSAGVVAGTKVTFTHAAGGNAPSIEIPVTNPTGLANVTSGITVNVDDVDTGAAKAAVVPAAYSLRTSYSVSVNPSTAVAGQTTNLTVTASVGGVVTSNALTYAVVNNNGPVTVATGSAVNGSFTIPMTFDLPTNAFANTYTVTITDANGYTGTATVNVKYDLQLDTVGDVYRGDIKTFTGKLLNGKGEAVAGKAVTLVNLSGPATVASATTASDGSFVFAYQFNSASKYSIQVGGSEYKTIEVKAKDGLSVTVSDTVKPLTTLDTTNLEVTVKNGDNTVATAVVTIEGPSGWVAPVATNVGAGVYRFAPGAWAAGTYTIKAKDGATVVGSTTYYNFSSSTTLTVGNPAKLNWSVAVADLDGVNTGIHPNPANAAVTVTIQDSLGGGFKTAPAVNTDIKKLVYTVTGPIATSKTYDSSTATAPAPGNGQTAFPVNVQIEQAGDIVVKGTVTYHDNSTETFEKTVAISGYVVTVEKTLGTVGSEVTLTATVTDTSGNPINNAIVTWASVTGNRFYDKDANGAFVAATRANVSVSSLTKSINNGVYTTTTKLASAGQVDIQVVRADAGTPIRAYFVGKVEGTPSYTVTTDKAAVVAGLSQTITVTTTNADGKAITALSNLKLESSALPATQQLANATAVDTNSDGVVDAYRFTVKPTKAGTITVTSETDGGNKVGTTTVAVNAPTVTANTVVTDSIKETVTVTYGDGVTAGAQLRVTPLGMGATGTVGAPGTGAFELLDSNNNSLFVFKTANASNYTFGTAAASHTFKVLAHDIKETGDAVAPQVKLEVSYDAGATWVEAARIAVTPVIIEVDKDEVFLGVATPVTVVVKDAHEVVLADTTVTASGASSATGTTDADGVSTLTVNPSSTGNIVFTVTLNSNNFTKTVKAVTDNVAPEITLDTLPTVVKSGTLTVTGLVKDNTKVSRIYVNNNEVLTIPGTETTFDSEVSLKLGKNVIRVFAFDAAGNASKAEVEVTYVLPTVVKMTLGTTDVTKDGQALTGLDVPAQSIGGRTMLPLRFAFETLLGGTVDYNNGVITVTYNGKTAVMTVGSTTAMVDGQAMTLLSAPVVQNGRALAPIREVLQAFGVTVGFDSATNSVTLSY